MLGYLCFSGDYSAVPVNTNSGVEINEKTNQKKKTIFAQFRSAAFQSKRNIILAVSKYIAFRFQLTPVSFCYFDKTTASSIKIP